MCRHNGAAEGSGALNVTGRELLPTNVVPRHYDLTLEPDFTKLTYQGTVIIDVDVADESKSISLNTIEIGIHSVKVSADGNLVR